MARPLSSSARARAAVLPPLLKWSLMSGALFWALVYKFSAAGLAVPDFVYVAF